MRTDDEIEEVELFEDTENHYDQTKHLFGPTKAEKSKSKKSESKQRFEF